MIVEHKKKMYITITHKKNVLPKKKFQLLFILLFNSLRELMSITDFTLSEMLGAVCTSIIMIMQ